MRTLERLAVARAMRLRARRAVVSLGNQSLSNRFRLPILAPSQESPNKLIHQEIHAALGSVADTVTQTRLRRGAADRDTLGRRSMPRHLHVVDRAGVFTQRRAVALCPEHNERTVSQSDRAMSCLPFHFRSALHDSRCRLIRSVASFAAGDRHRAVRLVI